MNHIYVFRRFFVGVFFEVTLLVDIFFDENLGEKIGKDFDLYRDILLRLRLDLVL